MEFIREETRVYAVGSEGNIMAEANFRIEGSALFVDRTFVDPSLRGQGVAGELMAAVVRVARERGVRIEPICSYAVDYFARHPELK